MSHMQTKGWHVDVADEQIMAAYAALDVISRVSDPIYYQEDPDPIGFGERRFYLRWGWGREDYSVVASFDSWGNLVIGPAFLTSGGLEDGHPRKEIA